jgi:hypothetical protein
MTASLIIAALCIVGYLVTHPVQDFYIVEWRTLTPEGNGVLKSWHSSSHLSRVVLSALGFRLDQTGSVYKGEVWVAQRAMYAFDDLAAAQINYDQAKDYRFHDDEGRVDFLWVVRARSVPLAKKALYSGNGQMLQGSKPFFPKLIVNRAVA